MPEDKNSEDRSYIEWLTEHREELLLRLKMRNKNYFWDLDFSLNSLFLLDLLIIEQMELIELSCDGERFMMERDLILEIAAYIIRFISIKHFGWCKVQTWNGQEIVFLTFKTSREDKIERIGIDIYHEVDHLLRIGESVITWYERLVHDWVEGNRTPGVLPPGFLCHKVSI